MDLEYHYAEEVVIAPRNFNFNLRFEPQFNPHYAVIGVATVFDGVPLYYDGVNEFGLCAAGLNFVGNAVFFDYAEGKNNVAAYEFIPWILSKYKTVSELKEVLKNTNLVKVPFNSNLPVPTLHWIISDKSESITVESAADGLKVYENIIGVLTNNPEFPYHVTNLSNYINLTSEVPFNRFSSELNIKPYSKGMGLMGLPGDWSSTSRFVRASFALHNSLYPHGEDDAISQFFHILNTVSNIKGTVHLGGGKYEYTIYTSCYDSSKGILYYTTYENGQINAVKLNNESLDSSELVRYPLLNKQKTNYIN